MRIINFHEINNPKWFESAINALISVHKPAVLEEVEEFYKTGKSHSNKFHITVDDGSLTDYTVIYPILKKHKITATLFVSPHIAKTEENFWFQEMEHFDSAKMKRIISDYLNIDFSKIEPFFIRSIIKNLKINEIEDLISIYKKRENLGKNPRRNMNVSEILELYRSGFFNFGAHTMTHPILANENDSDCKKQIQDSVNELSDILNKEIKHFAYPNGDKNLDFGQREKKNLHICNVEYAYSFEFRKMKKNDDLLSIPRFGLSHGDSNYIKRKIKWGKTIENIKKSLFNTEEKERVKVKKIIEAV